MDTATIVGLLTLLGSYIFLVIAWYIILVIANWKIFTKAGEAGWKSIIPIYNSYVVYKISWKTMWFWIGLLLGVVTGICDIFTSAGDTTTISVIFGVISAITGIASIVITVASQYKLSKSFGHGVGYTIGLIFLNPIFTLIIAFGSSQYQGADL